MVRRELYSRLRLNQGYLPDGRGTKSVNLAIVLGSGGVRSIASLGMIEVLHAEGVRPDLIVGCSAGALFGALIAAGHQPREAITMATTLWSREVTRKRRLLAVAQMLFPKIGRFDADFAMRDDGLILQRLERAFGNACMEDLPLPLRVAATDAATGNPVVLQKGSLVAALRASIAMPFMFKPQHIDGMRLVDGFLSDPLPVSAASDASYVIALGFPAPMPRRVDIPSRLLAQGTSAMTNNLMQARLAAAKANGMRLTCIFPTIERRVGLFDTEAMPYLVEAGRRATLEMMPDILKTLNAKKYRLENDTELAPKFTGVAVLNHSQRHTLHCV
jgi:NTE family protein